MEEITPLLKILKRYAPPQHEHEALEIVLRYVDRISQTPQTLSLLAKWASLIVYNRHARVTFVESIHDDSLVQWDAEKVADLTIDTRTFLSTLTPRERWVFVNGFLINPGNQEENARGYSERFGVSYPEPWKRMYQLVKRKAMKWFYSYRG